MMISWGYGGITLFQLAISDHAKQCLGCGFINQQPLYCGHIDHRISGIPRHFFGWFRLILQDVRDVRHQCWWINIGLWSYLSYGFLLVIVINAFYYIYFICLFAKQHSGLILPLKGIIHSPNAAIDSRMRFMVDQGPLEFHVTWPWHMNWWASWWGGDIYWQGIQE